MADLSMTDEDREVIRDILRARRDAGEANPLLPADVDVNGDGIADAFGLDEAGEVITVFGVPLEETVYASDGDDVLQFEPVDLGEPLLVDEED